MARRRATGKAPMKRGLTVYRLVRARRAKDAFDGEGARLFGGRWNPPGVPMVYTAAHLSLAALELFVHLEPDTAPDDWVSIRVQLPGSLRISRRTVADLPADWRAVPAPVMLQELGASWVRDGKTVALAVPSAVVPEEENVLLNPAHRDFSALRFGGPQPFSFDPRMWK